MILSRTTSHFVSNCSTNWAKGDLCWHSGGSYEPTMVLITLPNISAKGDLCWHSGGGYEPTMVLITLPNISAKGDLCWHSGGGYEPTMVLITLPNISAKGDLCWHSGGGGYEPTMVPITLVRGEYPLHSPHLKTHHTLMKISQLPVFNLTRFIILTTVVCLVGHKCNSRAYFISEKCNFPDRIRSRDLVSHCSTNWAEWDLH